MRRFSGSKLFNSAILKQRHDEMEDLFSPLALREALDDSENIPLMDMYESDEAITVEFDMPGFDPDNIHLRISGITLVLEAEKPKLHIEGQYICMERSTGRFCHALQLSGLIDPAYVRAEYRLGVLRVVCPKKGKDIIVPIKEIKP